MREPRSSTASPPAWRSTSTKASTKSFDYVGAQRGGESPGFHNRPPELTVDYAPGTVPAVTQHDGSPLRLRKLHTDYDLNDRIAAMTYMQQRHAAGEIVTGLLYSIPIRATCMGIRRRRKTKLLNALQEDALVPGAAALAKINSDLR